MVGGKFGITIKFAALISGTIWFLTVDILRIHNNNFKNGL